MTQTKAASQPNLKEIVVDIAEAASAQSEGTLYIQCLVKHRDVVQQRVEEIITAYTSKFPNEEIPEIITRHSKATDSLPLDTPTLNTWTTKYQTYFTEKRAHQSETKTKKSNIPGAISYSDMAARTVNNPSDQQNLQANSAMSSPTNSRMTAPSLREQQLEDELEYWKHDSNNATIRPKKLLQVRPRRQWTLPDPSKSQNSKPLLPNKCK